MTILFGNLDSGNVHKVALLFSRLGIDYHRVEVRQSTGDTKRSEFVALNPLGKVPVVKRPGGDVLSESGAILYFYGHSTELWPAEERKRAEVLRWMFFEQYSHEPTLAVLRYRRAVGQQAGEEMLLPGATRALDVLERALGRRTWIAGEASTLADYALYPYTKWAPEAGIELSSYPRVQRWLAQMEEAPGFLPLRSDAARSVQSFEQYFGTRPGKSSA